jgi:hypothetical protein
MENLQVLMKNLEEQYNLFNYKTNKKNSALCRKTLQQIKSSCQELRKSILEMSKEGVIPPEPLPAEAIEAVPESSPAEIETLVEPVVENVKKSKKVKKERKEGEKSGKRKKKSK